VRKNRTKVKLQQGEAVAGVFCNIPSPALVEILGLLGFDFVILDAEHGPAGVETIEHMVRSAEAVGATPIARIAENSPQNILRYLDAGAVGVQIPMVNTRQEAQQVVDAAKYPPQGQRGLASVRANGFGLERSMADYVRMANEETLVVAQVETITAMDNLADILSVDGIDVVFIGPTDLSMSMGFPGETTHPQVVQAIQRLGKEIQAAGKVAGTIAADAEAYHRWREAGFRYLCIGVSGLLIRAGREYLQGVRRQG